MTSKPVKWNRCDVPVKIFLDGEFPGEVICPECGTSETYEDLQESLGQQTLAYASQQIGRAFRDIARKYRHARYTPGKIGNHHPKFRVDL